MRRRHEVERCRATRLLLQEDFGQALFRDLDTEVFAADLVILAEGAAHIAAREEDRARPLLPRKTRLFPRMEGYERDTRVSAAAAEAALTLQAVDAAASRAKAASGERCESVCHAFFHAPLRSMNFLRRGARSFPSHGAHSRPSSFAASSREPYFGRHHERARTALM